MEAGFYILPAAEFPGLRFIARGSFDIQLAAGRCGSQAHGMNALEAKQNHRLALNVVRWLVRAE